MGVRRLEQVIQESAGSLLGEQSIPVIAKAVLTWHNAELLALQRQLEEAQAHEKQLIAQLEAWLAFARTQGVDVDAMKRERGLL